MGGGGAAPPVKSEDVMILIGSTILLTLLVIQAWSTPTPITPIPEYCEYEDSDDEECERFSVKYDLSEGDEFTMEVVDGEVLPSVVLPDGSVEFGTKTSSDWSYTAELSGVHTFQIEVDEESSIDYSISRGILIDYGLYPVGLLVLGFGILKRVYKEKDDEPLEAVLDN